MASSKATPQSSVGTARRAGPVIMKLAALIRKSGSLVYRRELGLAPAQWRALALIGDDGPLSLRALSELMASDKGQTSRIVADLVGQGWVRSDPNGRQVELALTASGRALHRRLTVISHRRNDALLAGLDARDRKVLFRCLDTLGENAMREFAASDALAPSVGPRVTPRSLEKSTPLTTPSPRRRAAPRDRPDTGRRSA